MKSGLFFVPIAAWVLGVALGYRLVELSLYSTQHAFWAGVALGFYHLANVKYGERYPRSLESTFLCFSFWPMLFVALWRCSELEVTNLASGIFGYVGGVLGPRIILMIVIVIMALLSRSKKT